MCLWGVEDDDEGDFCPSSGKSSALVTRLMLTYMLSRERNGVLERLSIPGSRPDVSV